MVLEYEKEILDNISQDSYLTIMARGLTYNKILEIFLSFFNNEESLVFIVNMNEHDIKFFSSLNMSFFYDVSKLNTQQRSKKYNEGGIFYGTSRVLISDFINNNVNVERISTLLIFNAEAVDSESNDAFICYLFKEKNKLGLIRGFSSNPIRINQKNLDDFTRSICVSKIQFYPRFHEKIKNSMPELDVNQVFFKTPNYIDECILIIEDLMKKILNDEFNKTSSPFELSSILLHQQSNYDIRSFKRLISHLFNSSILNSYLYFKSMMESQKVSNQKNSWIYSEQSHVLLDILKDELLKTIENATSESREFIFDVENSIFKLKIDQVPERTENSIEEENKETDNDDSQSDNESKSGCFDEDFISEIFESSSLSNFYLSNTKIKKVIEILDKSQEKRNLILVPNRSIRKCFKHALVSVGRDSLATVMTHYEFQFSFENFDQIIMVSPDLGSIRHIEYLSSIQKPYQTIIFQYKNSIEEQRFLQEIREEKESFENLILNRARLPLRLELEKIDLDDEYEDQNFEITIDSREMRSKLPFSLYKAGNKINIKVMEIGDYLIGKNRCIERKSIEDFIGSLNTGRLYSQAHRLSHSFKNPILLIEFNNVKPVIGDYDRISEFKNSYIARFCLFLYNFPNFQIIWSNSPIQSVKLIRDIQKKNILEEINENEVDPILHEILLCIPGISSFNVSRICKEFSNIHDLAFSDQYRLEKVMDPVSAAKVFEFFRQKFPR